MMFLSYNLYYCFLWIACYHALTVLVIVPRLNGKSILHDIICNSVNKIKRIEIKTKIDKINSLFNVYYSRDMQIYILIL